MTMDAKKTKKLLKRGLAYLFALTLAIAFVPGLGLAPASQAEAAGVSQDGEGYTVTVTGIDGGITMGKVAEITVKVTGGTDAKISYANIDSTNLSRNTLFEGVSTPIVKAWVNTGVTGVTTGVYNLKVEVLSGGVWTTHTFPFTVVPKAPSLRKSDFETTYNSATIQTGRWGYDNGDKVEIYTVENGKAVYRAGVLTTDTSGSVTVTGLKANKAYEFLAAGYSKNAGAYSKLSSRVTVRTGTAAAPALKSVKASGAKMAKSKRRWISGYWSGGHWTSGRWTGGGYYTSFTLKVVLKSTHPGQRGIIVNGKKISGTGKNFKVKMTLSGKRKGKRAVFNIRTYRDSTYLGTSKPVTKKVTVK